MRIIYECEKVAILQENEMFIVHVLDNYRLVKEITVKRCDLLSTLQNEFNLKKVKKRLFSKKEKSFKKINEIDIIKNIIL